MQNGKIRDDHIEACCSLPDFPPSNARINKHTSWTTCINECINDTWIQTRFDQPVAIGGIQTRGRGDNDQWVTRFDLMLGLNLSANSPTQLVNNYVSSSHLIQLTSPLFFFLANSSLVENDRALKVLGDIGIYLHLSCIFQTSRLNSVGYF